jgi:hypothetical protein
MQNASLWIAGVSLLLIAQGMLPIHRKEKRGVHHEGKL